MRDLTLDPFIPLALWVPLAVAAAGLMAWYAAASRRRLPRRRWPVVIALMALVVVVPLAILLNPTWLERVPPPAGKPLLTILVDRSASMATRDADNGASRFEAAAGIAQEAARRLEDRYEVRVRAFAENSTLIAPDQLARQPADGASTDLAAAVEESLDADRPQGQAVLLLSDGGHNAGGGAGRVMEAVTKAKAMAAPLYIKTLGGPTVVRDLEVALHMPQELAFVKQKVPVAVTLRQRGTLARKTSLALLQDGRTIEKRDVDLKPDGTTETTLYVTQEKAGLYRYELRADPLPEEVTELNNRATLLLRVIDQPVCVLLLEGKPYWDTKFLIRTLSSDLSIELVSVVQMAEGRLLERKTGRSRADEWTVRKDASTVLSAPEALVPYQIIVLGRDAEVFLSDQALGRLKKWLNESEGSLVCFRGPPASQISQRLGELMPVRWTPSRESRFRVQWTPIGQALRWLPAAQEGEDALAGLPSLASVARPERTAPLAEVLATTVAGKESQESPAISYQPVGSGRVVVIEGAGMWRWAFLPPQYQQHDDLYGTLWRSLIRWMVSNVGLLPSQQMALRTDKVTFSTLESATATLLVRQPGTGAKIPAVELTGDSLPQPKSFTPIPSGSDPGQFRIAFGRLPEGRYLARVAAEGAADKTAFTAAFDVRGHLAERLEVRAQPNVMKAIAEKSGGAALDDASPASLAQRFDQHLALTRPERIVRTTAWDRWWVLLGTMAVWGAAWGLRRWSGLV